jgi:RHS repeat-associated protein
LTGAAGALALAQSFDPYGGLLSSQGSAATPYGFTGEWGDASGLLYLRARYYLPQAGIFTSRDPFPGFTTLPVTLQPYLYAAGNPLRYTDPSGKFIFLALLAAAAVGGLIGGVGYYGLQLYFNHDPCARWNWKDAVFWGGVGTGIGALLGVGTYGGWWVGAQLGWWGTAAGGTAAAQQIISKVQNIPASHIRFTQNNISPATRAGLYLDDLAQEIENGFFRGYIRVVEFEGNLYSLDNRRLAAFKLLDVDVPVLIEDLSNPAIQAEFARKFSTITEGLSILIRGTGVTVR